MGKEIIYDKYKMEVNNRAWNENQSKRCNHPLLPQVFRGLIIGKSGCGKTTILINRLLRPGWLDYNKINIFGKSLFPPVYRIAKKVFKKVTQRSNYWTVRKPKRNNGVGNFSHINCWRNGEREYRQTRCWVQFLSIGWRYSQPQWTSSEKNNLMVFDDLLLEKQNTCESYYARGRHSNVDCFHLAQNYFRLPRQIIRENTNLKCLFPQDLKNLNHIFEDHVWSDMTKEELSPLCKAAWEKKTKRVCYHWS